MSSPAASVSPVSSLEGSILRRSVEEENRGEQEASGQRQDEVERVRRPWLQLDEGTETGPGTETESLRRGSTGAAAGPIWRRGSVDYSSISGPSAEGHQRTTSLASSDRNRRPSHSTRRRERSSTARTSFHNGTPRSPRVGHDVSSSVDFLPTRPFERLARQSPRRSPPNSETRPLCDAHPHMGTASRRLSATQEILLPSWQSDSEVSQCPICSRQFTFWFRKHHCRKCGRVVCANCSPHRITIPRQFIVRPGESTNRASTASASGSVVRESTDSSESVIQQGIPRLRASPRPGPEPGLGGGEEVRLCNPCVPDPQPSPQTSMDLVEFLRQGPSRSEVEGQYDQLHHSEVSRSNAVPVNLYSHVSPSREARELRRQRGRGMIFQPEHGNLNTIQTEAEEIPEESLPAYGNFNYTLIPNYTRSGRPPRYRSGQNPASPPPDYTSPGSSSAPITNHEQPRLASTPVHRSTRNHAPGHARYASMDVLTRPTVPRHHRPRVTSLLDTDPAFIRSSTFSGRSPSRAQTTLSEEDICPVCHREMPARGGNGEETAREAHIVDCIAARDPSTGPASPGRQSMTRFAPSSPVHMLPFAASEKDCVGEDGRGQECSICFVEYEVGEQLARLECLCKFHETCIVAWFARKQECPVHKVA